MACKTEVDVRYVLQSVACVTQLPRENVLRKEEDRDAPASLQRCRQFAFLVFNREHHSILLEKSYVTTLQFAGTE